MPAAVVNPPQFLASARGVRCYEVGAGDDYLRVAGGWSKYRRRHVGTRRFAAVGLPAQLAGTFIDGDDIAAVVLVANQYNVVADDDG